MFAARNVYLRLDSKNKLVKLFITFAVLDVATASMDLLRAIEGKFLRVVSMRTGLSSSKYVSNPCLFLCYLLFVLCFFVQKGKRGTL